MSRTFKELAQELEGENELILFNPLTGESVGYESLSDINKYYYDLHKEIAQILKQIPDEKRYPRILTVENGAYVSGWNACLHTITATPQEKKRIANDWLKIEGW